MEQIETEFFKLLDSHSRRQYRCFLAEMFLNRAKDKYILCFRPAGGTINDANRYACRYFELDVEEMRQVCSAHALTIGVSEKLHRELSSLGGGDKR